MKQTREWATELMEEMDSKDFGGLEIIPVIESVLKRFRGEVLEEAAKLAELHKSKCEACRTGIGQCLIDSIRDLRGKP